MSVEDAQMVRSVMRDIGRRPVDISELQVSVTHGTVYLRGKIKAIRGYHQDLDLEEEINNIGKMLRQRPGIREVISEVQTVRRSIGGTERKKRTMSL